MATLQYTMNDYTTILFGNAENKAMSYKLPVETMSIIQSLIKKIGIPDIVVSDYKPRHTDNHTHNGRNRYNTNSAKANEDSWISSRDFKPTVVVEKKEGGEKMLHEIRIALNKISAKNYDTNKDTIFQKMAELVALSSSVGQTDVVKVANTIFEIASTNKFFSEMYAKLYKDLTVQFPDIFSGILNVFVEGFTETMKTIRYVDQKANFDEFCKYNKDNDKRKATSVFITNLVKMEVIGVEVLICMIKEIFGILDEYMNRADCVNEVEEITENIFLLMTNHLDLLPRGLEINETVRRISEMKPKELPSISSRAIFKYKDILDKWKV